MEDSTKTIRPHKPYAKHGRAAKRARKSVKPPIPPKVSQNGSKPLTKPKAVPRPTKLDMSKSSGDFDKMRIVRLLLAGAAPKDIASKCNISLNHCNNMIRQMNKDIETLTWQDYLSLLLSKLRLFIDNHTQNSADLQLMLLDCDNAIKDTHKAIERESDKSKALRLSAHMVKLRAERLALMRELNANNTALTTNLSKMGVTNVPTTTKNKVPTQSSTGGEIPRLEELPLSYTDMGKEALLGALRDSNKDVGRYLRAETARKKEQERDSDI